jgi:hypothetical protein
VSKLFHWLTPLILFALVGVAFQFIPHCTGQTGAERAAEAVRLRELEAYAETFADSAHQLRTQKDELIAYYEAKQAQSDAELAAAVGQRDRLLRERMATYAHVDAVTSVRLETSIRSLSIPLSLPAPCAFTRVFRAVDSTKTVVGHLTQDTITLDSVLVPARISVIVGTKPRAHWFAKPTYTAEAISSNPHVRITGLAAVTNPAPPPWYQRRWADFAGGGLGLALVGAAVYSLIPHRTTR